jgi:hypothetical protein
MKTLTHVLLSLFLILFANRPRGGRRPAGDFFLESRDLQILSFCRLQLALEGGEEPEADAARTLPSPSVL